MRLYGRCREIGSCSCGLCDKIRVKYSREEYEYIDTHIEGLADIAVADLGPKELTCGYHTGSHRSACWGYVRPRHVVPEMVAETPEVVAEISKYRCPACKWVGVWSEYYDHYGAEHTTIPTPRLVRRKPAIIAS